MSIKKIPLSTLDILLPMLFIAATFFTLTNLSAFADEGHGNYETATAQTEGPKQLSEQAKANIGLKTQEVDFRTIHQIVKLNGVVITQPKLVAVVSPRVGGIVTAVYFALGDRVEKRQKLLEIESIELQNSQVELIGAYQNQNRLKTALEKLKEVSAKKIILELQNLQTELILSYKNEERLKKALLQLQTVSEQKIFTELENMRVELVKAHAEQEWLSASLSRIKSLAEKRISAQKELQEKEAEYAKGKSELDGAKRKFQLLGVEEETIAQILHSKGDQSILSVLGFLQTASAEDTLGLNPGSVHIAQRWRSVIPSDGASAGSWHGLLEKYAVLLEDPNELISTEAEYKGVRLLLEANKKRILAAGLGENQIREILQKGEASNFHSASFEELLQNYVALLEAPSELVNLETDYRAALIEFEAKKRKLLTFGLTEAQVAQIIEQKQLIKTLAVFSPMSGQIVEQQVTLGATVEPQEKLFKIINISTVWVEGNVPESYLAQVEPGQDVRIGLATYPSEIFTGKVSYLSDALDTQKRTAQIWIEVENKRGKLKPGMFAELAVVVGGQEKAVAVPIEAVLSEGPEKFVFVELFDVYEKQEVVLGVSDGRYVEIKDGLIIGDIVVTQGNHQLMSAASFAGQQQSSDGHTGHAH